MKRLFRTTLLLIVSLLFALVNLSAQDSTKQVNVVDMRQEIAVGNFAIVVGVNNYAEDDIADLSYCEKDALDFAGALTAEGGYDANRVKLFLGSQATYTAIYAALKSCAEAKNIPPKSSILFYFSGHGFAYENGNYIIPQDGTVFPDLIQTRNLNLETIESMLASSPFERQLVFIDACRNQVTAGGRDVGVKGFIDTPLTANAKGMKVFLGTEFGQVSRESTDIQSGIFTHFLVEGLAGAADTNHDGIVLFNELSGYVSTKMEERNIGSKYPQRPVTRGEGSELIPVAALVGGMTESTTAGSTTGGTVEAVTAVGTGSADGFGTLKLSIGLDGVQCYIDGTFKGSSTGGAITVADLSPGDHTIKLVKEGYETREFKAQVFAGQVIEKSLNFSKISGIIRVTSNVYPYNIYLDGVYVTLCQSASFDITDVSYGPHTVVLKKSGYGDAEYKVTITGSAPVAVQGNLVRVYGQLTVVTNPTGAIVKIESSDTVVISAGFSGKSFSSGTEASTSEPLNLTPGSYTVTITKDGYETITKSITIVNNAPAVIDVELKERTQPITPPLTTGNTKPTEIVSSIADWSKGARRVRKLIGHRGIIGSVAFSPDGQYALTGSDDNTAKLWSIQDGRCVCTFTGHKHWVVSVAFSPDGKLIATGSGDKTAKIWRVIDGVCLLTLFQNTPVRAIAFSPDGEYLATGNEDNTALIWSVQNGNIINTLSGHENYISSVAYSPDGQFLLTGSIDRTAKLWSISDEKCIRTFNGHTGSVYSVSFSPDGLYVLTGSYDRTAKLWSVKDRTCIKTFIGHDWDVNSVAFSPDGSCALTGSVDSSAKIWSVPEGVCILTLTLPGTVFSAKFSSDGRNILCGSGYYWNGSKVVEPAGGQAEAFLATLFECTS